MTEHTALPRPGHRNARARHWPLGHEHPDDRVTRRRIAELLIGSPDRDRELDPGDHLAQFQRRREHAGEEIIGLDPALVGADRRPHCQRRGRIVGGRVVVGDGPADGAAMTHRFIADAAGQSRQRRNRRLDRRARRDVGMPGHRADAHHATGHVDAGQAEAGQVNDGGRLRQALFQHRNIGHAASQRASLSVRRQRRDRVRQAAGLLICEIVHLSVPFALPQSAASFAWPAWMIDHNFGAVAGISRCRTP